MAVDRRLTKVRVALLADALEPDPDGVCAVVDVIRASTTLVTLAESGDPEVWLAASPDAARSRGGSPTRNWKACVDSCSATQSRRSSMGTAARAATARRLASTK